MNDYTSFLLFEREGEIPTFQIIGDKEITKEQYNNLWKTVDFKKVRVTFILLEYDSKGSVIKSESKIIPKRPERQMVGDTPEGGFTLGGNNGEGNS